MNKYILTINSTSDPIEISLLKDFQLVDTNKYPKKNNEAKKLLFEIDKLINKNTLNIKNIDKIAVSIGEGSYTGTRIGVSIANALAYALNIEIIELKNSELKNCSVGEFMSNTKGKSTILKDMVLPIYSKPPTIT